MSNTELNYNNIERTFFKGMTPIYTFVRDSMSEAYFDEVMKAKNDFMYSAHNLLLVIKKHMENGKYTTENYDWHMEDCSCGNTDIQKEIDELDKKIKDVKQE